MTYQVIAQFWITLPDETGDQDMAGYFAIHDHEPWQKCHNVGDLIDVEPAGDFGEEDIEYLLKYKYIKQVNE